MSQEYNMRDLSLLLAQSIDQINTIGKFAKSRDKLVNANLSSMSTFAALFACFLT